MLTREKIEQYRMLKIEAANMEKRIGEIATGRVIEGGSVKGSDVMFPWLKRSFDVEGIRSLSDAEKEIIKRWQKIRDRAAEVAEEIESELAKIEDVELRLIVRFRMDGVPWQKIPRKMGRRGDGSTQKKKYYRAIKKRED